MILCIPRVLAPDQLTRIVGTLQSAPFVDGRVTANEHAGSVKENMQLDEQAPCHQELSAVVTAAVRDNSIFQLAAYPKTLLSLRFNRYSDGMRYGEHVDDPLSNGARSDISLTVFLTDPDTYDGGELVINAGGVEQPVKLTAGSLVLYPSNTLHRVEPVTRGERLAAVGWVQSLIRDPARRELLFELDMARRSLLRAHGKTKEFDSITKSVANLVRMWAEP